MTRRCPQCRRAWHSEQAYTLYIRRLAVENSLRHNVTASHLEPIEVEVSKMDRKRAVSSAFQRTGERV